MASQDPLSAGVCYRAVVCNCVGQAEGGEQQTKHIFGELGRSYIMKRLVASKKLEFLKSNGNPLKAFYLFKE